MEKRDTILLVEDSADDETLILHALARSGHRDDVVVVRDGEEALDWLFARGHHAPREPAVLPRVVLLDLRLPRVDGVEVLRALRADPRTSGAVVAVLTCSSDDEDVVRHLDLGPVHFIRKPGSSASQFAEDMAILASY